MKSTNDVFSFKTVLAKLPRGEPLGSAMLAKYGVSAFRASALARSGWLTHLVRGVYMLPGDTLTRDACLALGLQVEVMPAQYTLPALVQALVDHVTRDQT